MFQTHWFKGHARCSPSSQDGVDEACQIRDREVARAVLVGPLKKGIQVSGGAKESHEFLLAEDAIGIGIGFRVPFGGRLPGDPIPLDPIIQSVFEFLQIQGA